MRNQMIELRVQQRFAACEGEHERTQPSNVIDASLEQLHRHWRGHLVILRTIAAAEVAASSDYELHEQGPSCGGEHQRATCRAAQEIVGEEHVNWLV